MTGLDPAADSSGQTKPSLARLTSDAVDLVRAARDLIETEWALSQQSLRRFVAGALVVPILATSFWFAVNGLLIAMLHSFGCGWNGAFAIDVCIQLAILLALLHALQRCVRNMSFPNSRRALERVKKEFS